MSNGRYDPTLPKGKPLDVSVVVINRDFTPGRRIRLQRVALDWRQCDLGCAARVPPSDISALERDLPVPDSVRTRALTGLRLDADGD